MIRNKIEERDIGRKGKLLILAMLPTLFLIVGIISMMGGQGELTWYQGLSKIVFSPTILMTDFLKVGGMSAALINVAAIGYMNLAIMNHYKLKVNGVLIAAFFTLIGFSFFGKNILNILPIYLGGYLYTRRQGISFKDILVVIMFGTALSPMISEISFSGILPLGKGLFAALVVGVFIGFVIVPLSSHMLKFHDGYNLYNIGFTAGIIGTVLTSFLRSFGIRVEPVYIVSESNNWVILTLLVIMFAALFVAGIRVNKNALAEYKNILKYKGRLITDFTHLVGYGVTFINMSLLGFLTLIFIWLIGGIVNGPVLAGIFTVVGFGAFGKHPKNILPVVLGVITAIVFFGKDISSTGMIISILFSTTLAPVAGNYGPVIGFIAGMLHMVLVTNVGVIHGGINLYNNGFSGGLVAGVLLPVIDAFKKER